MTIAAAYLTSEGVVLGADSTATVFSRETSQAVQLFNHAQKIFELGPPQAGRMALCTWGPNGVGSVSHRTIGARLADSLTEGTSVKAAAEKLVELVDAQARQDEVKTPTDIGYFLGGSDSGTRLPRCFRVHFSDQGPRIEALKVGQFALEGAPEMFIRAKLGVDPRFLDKLQELLREKLQAPADDFNKLFTSSVDEAAAASRIEGYDDLPLREAVDFCNMYLHLTIKSFKFRFGPAICGGPIELAIISTDRPFRWVRHKRFDSAVVQEEVGEC